MLSVEDLIKQQVDRNKPEEIVSNPDQELVDRIREVRDSDETDPFFKLLHDQGRINLGRFSISEG